MTHRRDDRGKSSGTYNSWRSMILRCHNPNRRDFQWYGQRGVQVCPQWLTPKYGGCGGFERFLADMGERPPGMTIDRIDVMGHYEPSNCRWATDKMQANNRQVHEEDWDYDPDEHGYRIETKWPEVVVILPEPLRADDADLPF